jgi:peptide/nickel transport system substrate-binding protein
MSEKEGREMKKSLKMCISLALMFLLMFVALNGFAGSKKEEAPAPEEKPAAKVEGPVRGGTFHFARDSEPATLNPIGANDNASIFALVQIFDTLVESTHAPTPQPAIAESWKVSDDGLTWTFKLRKATFSNGDPVTAEDVKFSIDRFANPDINSFYAGFGAMIERTEIVDASTFRIYLNRVDGAFLDYLSTFIPSIIPKKIYEQMGDEAFSEKPIGSGPFMVNEWVRGEKLVLDRNPYYWKEGQPYVDRIVFYYVPDDNTRMLKVESGEAHIATEVPYGQIERLNAIKSVNVQIEDVMAWDAIWFNIRKPPLDDKNIRQALNYATPKEAMLKTLMHGAGEIANHVIAKVKYWDPSVSAYPYDMAKAKELMAKSKAPNGFSMPMLIVAGDSVERQQAEIVQAEWAKLGVKITIEAVDVGTIWDRWLSSEEMCFTLPGNALSSDALSDDNLGLVFFDFTAGAESFWTGWNNPRAIELVQKAGKTLDENVRRQTYHEVQRLVMEDAPAVPLFFTKARTALRDNVHGFSTLPVKWWNLEDVWIEK